MKRMIIACALFAFAVSAQAQLLKKLKDKVNKTVGSDDKKSAEQAGPGSGNNSNDHWCDTITTNAAGADGVSYTRAYSGSGNMSIVYDESSLGLQSNPSGYRLILSQYSGGKTLFTVVENGKVIDSDTKVKSEYLGKGPQSQSSDNSNVANDEMKKYIVPDTSSQTLPKTSAKSVTVQSVSDDQMEMALNMMRQTDEYKKKTPAEQKAIEDDMKKGMAMNNSMAGQTINVPASKGGSYGMLSGYKLVVNGKNYGKFMSSPSVFVSRDGSTVFAVGADDKAVPIMITQSKKTALDRSKFSGYGGRMLHSPDYKKAAYLEQKQLSGAELQRISSGGAYKMMFTVLRNDGSTSELTDYSGAGKFQLTNSGNIICINESTGEVYSDNKKLGQFRLSPGEHIESNTVMIGGSPSSVGYYNGSTGSLNYLDGSVKKLGIMYPGIVTENGKTYMSWFRKCKNDIYIGKIAY